MLEPFNPLTCCKSFVDTPGYFLAIEYNESPDFTVYAMKPFPLAAAEAVPACEETVALVTDAVAELLVVVVVVFG